MQNFRNYYSILGVESNASPEEVKRAFRRQARRYHPDMNPGDKAAEEKFKKIGEAYEVLSDVDKRSQYDQYSRFWQQKSDRRSGIRVGRKGNGNGSGEEYFKQYPDFNQFVDDLLAKKQSSSQAPNRSGTSRRVDTEKSYRPGTTKTAYRVSANGRIPVEPRLRPRDVEATLTLPLKKAYRGGRERIRLEDGRSLEVDLPMGMVDNQRVRLRNQGIDGGDLYLRISLEPHDFFELQGGDIFCRLPLTPSEAVLGGSIEVPTLDGLVRMNIPNGVRFGQRLRLANKGYPIDGKRGDQLVEIQIAVPKEITPEEKDLYDQLRRIEEFKPRRNLLG